MFFDESLRCLKRVELTHINHLQIVFHQSHDFGTMADREVEVDDAELIRKAVHQWEETGRERVDATEGEGIKWRVDSGQWTVMITLNLQGVIDG